MKALVKLAPIVVILACAASLYFTNKLAGIKAGLEDDNQQLTTKLGDTESRLDQTREDLAARETELKEAREETEGVRALLEAEKVKLAHKTTEVEDLETKVAGLERNVRDAEADKDRAEKTVAQIKQAMRSEEPHV